MAHIVVLGTGLVGAAIAERLEQLPGVAHSVVGISADAELTDRSDRGRIMLLEHFEDRAATAVINVAGLLRGSDELLHAVNAEWPRWLAHDVIPGTGARLVHIGSAAEYGDPRSNRPIPETAAAAPLSQYGRTKWDGSAAVLDARRNGLDAVVARGFTLVSDRLAPSSPLHQFVSDVSALPPEGGRVQVWDPATTRDFVLLEDLAEAVVRLAIAPMVPGLVNVCSGVGISFGDAVRAIATKRHRTIEVVSLHRPGIASVIGDPTLLASVTGLRPEMSAALLGRTADI